MFFQLNNACPPAFLRATDAYAPWQTQLALKLIF